jgi:hypothetical protein
MSSTIWTQSAASSRIATLTAEPWRVVEAQHRISTRKLVDSAREQTILEDLLESAKPPAVQDSEHLHYLLSTPFRYPPLPHGSRFGTRWEPGIWYGSGTLPTAFAEVAYYRLLFLEGTDADLSPLETDLTVFRVKIRTAYGLDLAAPAFNAWRARLASKVSYAETQPLGERMRDEGVEAFRYASARDAHGGTNIGLFTPRAFATRRPHGLQTWHAVATPAGVELVKRDYFDAQAYRCAREAFLVRGTLPHPAVL